MNKTAQRLLNPIKTGTGCSSSDMSVILRISSDLALVEYSKKVRYALNQPFFQRLQKQIIQINYFHLSSGESMAAFFRKMENQFSIKSNLRQKAFFRHQLEIVVYSTYVVGYILFLISVYKFTHIHSEGEERLIGGLVQC